MKAITMAKEDVLCVLERLKNGKGKEKTLEVDFALIIA